MLKVMINDRYLSGCMAKQNAVRKACISKSNYTVKQMEQEILMKAIKVTYNGIQEGITYDLHLFTEHTTGSTFGIKTDTENVMKMVASRTKEFIKKFESSETGI